MPLRVSAQASNAKSSVAVPIVSFDNLGSGDPGTKVIFADGHEMDFTDKTLDKGATK